MELNIAIIGFCPRGLSIFERFVSKKISKKISQKLNIFIFDPKSLGSGCHTKQPRRVLANTVASQMTIFADETICGNEFFIQGPSFYDFLHLKGYQSEKNSYYSRSLLAEYLRYSFCFIKKMCNKNQLETHIIKEQALNIERKDSFFEIHTNKTKVQADAVFVTTGHKINEKNQNRTYPLETSTQGLGHKDIVDIKGMGLSAIDVVTLLTSGNGGYFEKNNNKTIYIPSGKEPKILMFSRSNLPLMARAINQKEVSEQYKAIFFTPNKIKELKKKNKKLDFEIDVLPLIIKEMEYVYSYTYLKSKSIQKSLMFRNEYILSSDSSQIINKYISKKNQFNFNKIINPLKEPKNIRDFNNQIITYLKEDIKEANLGNLTSPLKASCDILRDLRDTLRYCIDFGGLTEKSHSFFIESFVPTNNRLCVGPPLVKIEELKALIEANVVSILYKVQIKKDAEKVILKDYFNKNYQINKLIDAKIDSLKINDDPFLNSIIKNNLGSKFKNKNLEFECFNINKNFNSISINKSIIKNLFILGLPTEGIKFYTFILPRPFIKSTFLVDSNNAVETFISGIKK